VTLTNPVNNAFFMRNTPIGITATVVDADGILVDVSLEINGNPFTLTNASGNMYNANWTPMVPGNYTITVTATDNDGLMTTATVVVTITDATGDDDNTPPVAGFTANPLSSNAPLDVFFDASASTDADGDALTYTWDFGLNTTAAGITTSNTFTSPGIYPVTLTVDDGRGGIDSASTNITVIDPTPQAPTAVIFATPTEGGAPLNVNFDGTGSTDANADALTYAWDFGDGNSSTSPTITHTYTAIGNYAVSLTVDDGNGGMDVATTTITVRENTCGLVLNYLTQDVSPADNIIRPYLQLDNTGNEAIDLQGVTIRYWYTREGAADQNVWIDWAQVGSGNVTTNFVPLATPVTGADHYLEIGFTAAAGSLSPGGNSGPVQVRFSKADWSNYDETDDYSFNPDYANFTPWENVTVYCDGLLTWGTEPNLVSLPDLRASGAEALRVYPNPNDGWFKIELQPRNEQATSLSIHDLTGRVVWRDEGSYSSGDAVAVDLPPGLYLLSAELGAAGRVTRRVIVQ